MLSICKQQQEKGLDGVGGGFAVGFVLTEKKYKIDLVVYQVPQFSSQTPQKILQSITG